MLKKEHDNSNKNNTWNFWQEYEVSLIRKESLHRILRSKNVNKFKDWKRGSCANSSTNRKSFL